MVGSAYKTLVQYVRVAERTANEKAERGLYRFASGIGKAAGKRDMKNIFKGKMERLDYREIAKAIEWPIGGGFSSLEIR